MNIKTSSSGSVGIPPERSFTSLRPSVRPYAWKISIVKRILHAIINTSHHILARKKIFYLLNATKENSYMGRPVYVKSHNENEKEYKNFF